MGLVYLVLDILDSLEDWDAGECGVLNHTLETQETNLKPKSDIQELSLNQQNKIFMRNVDVPIL